METPQQSSAENTVIQRCEHISTDYPGEVHQHYTGVGYNINIYCNECNANRDTVMLKQMTLTQFNALEADLFFDDVTGSPQVRIAEDQLTFSSNHILVVHEFDVDDVVDVIPSEAEEGKWLVLVENPMRLYWCYTNRDPVKLDIATKLIPQDYEKYGVKLSPSERYLSVVWNKGNIGIVIDLLRGEIMMELDRGTYHNDQTDFPILFFRRNNEEYLVASTDWNKLDCWKLNDGQPELLTEREYIYQGEEKNSIDYFYGPLYISPDGQNIISEGWQWHPIGVVLTWNLENWILKNPHEPQASYTTLQYTDYFWGKGLTFIDNNRIAVYGHGHSDVHIFPSAEIINIQTGVVERWFAGPLRTQFFREGNYLYSWDKETLSIWNIADESQVYNDTCRVFSASNRSIICIKNNELCVLTRETNNQ